MTKIPHYDANRRYATAHTAFDAIDTAEKAYLIGLLCADGNVSKSMVRIEVQQRDSILCDIFNKLLGGPPSKTYTRPGRAPTVVTWINSPPLVEALKILGVTENKSRSLSLRWDLISTELHWAVALGVADGDGCWCLDKCRSQSTLQIVNGSEKFARQLTDVIPNATLSPRQGLFCVRVRGIRNLLITIPWFYLTNISCLPRKKEKAALIQQVISR
jgi:hypothetical protein